MKTKVFLSAFLATLVAASPCVARTALTADMTMSVATPADGGNDENDCVVDPCATIQRAFDLLYRSYDMAGYKVTVAVGPGSFAGATVAGVMPGMTTIDSLRLVGSQSNDDFRIITSMISLQGGARLQVEGFKLTSTFGPCLGTDDGGTVLFYKNVNFGSCAQSHVTAGPYSRIKAVGNYAISGSAPTHMNASGGQAQINNGWTVTIKAPVSFSYFALSIENGLIDAAGVTYSYAPGAYVAGAPYGITTSAVIYTGGIALPGNSPGYACTKCDPPY